MHCIIRGDENSKVYHVLYQVRQEKILDFHRQGKEPQVERYSAQLAVAPKFHFVTLGALLAEYR